MTFSCLSLMLLRIALRSKPTYRSVAFKPIYAICYPIKSKNIVNLLDTRKQTHNSTPAEVSIGPQGATHQSLLKKYERWNWTEVSEMSTLMKRYDQACYIGSVRLEMCFDIRIQLGFFSWASRGTRGDRSKCLKPKSTHVW